MFTEILNHPATTDGGHIGGYIPQGFTPWAPEPCQHLGSLRNPLPVDLMSEPAQGCVLHNGDPVRVESVWDRGDGFVLLYVRSMVTGAATHIAEYDYLPIDRIIATGERRDLVAA